jgi:hypothetical protein
MKRFLYGMYTRSTTGWGLALTLLVLASPALDVRAKEARVHASACRTQEGVPATYHGA